MIQPARIFAAFLFLSAITCMTWFSACTKEDSYNTDPGLKLRFSADSILFDTVFTTLGSATRVLMVYNPENKPLMISAIGLESGAGSNYRINVDGIAGTYIQDIEIAADDSIFIFIKVRVDPTSQNSPLVISDQLFFEINGNKQEVELVAWGQDANYIVADQFVQGLPPYKIIAGANVTAVWSKEKPYVVYGYAVVDSLGILIVDPGARIHFHKNSGLWVYRYGSIRVNGTLEEPVTFQGDRLEEEYRDIPGQWDRIWLNEGSVDNVINYAIIRNGFIGLQTETLSGSAGNRLLLSNTVIHNMSGWGLFSRFYTIEAWNCEFSECGLDAAYLSTGGTYDFRHCTFADYWSGALRKTPAVIVSNYYEDSYNQVTYTGDLKKAFFGNCIIYGNLPNEIGLAKEPGPLFNYRFENCLIRTEETIDSLFSCQVNVDPLFAGAEEHDYTLQENSPARGTGSAVIANPFPNDYFGNPRLPSPDLGAYQFVPGKK